MHMMHRCESMHYMNPPGKRYMWQMSASMTVSRFEKNLLHWSHNISDLILISFACLWIPGSFVSDYTEEEEKKNLESWNRHFFSVAEQIKWKLECMPSNMYNVYTLCITISALRIEHSAYRCYATEDFIKSYHQIYGSEPSSVLVLSLINNLSIIQFHTYAHRLPLSISEIPWNWYRNLKNFVFRMNYTGKKGFVFVTRKETIFLRRMFIESKICM